MLNARQRDAVANAHPFQCEGDGCGSCFITARYAARCCEKSCVDLRDGTVTVYSEQAEQEARRQEEYRWAQEAKEFRFECSCGECYRTVDAARNCRKCRVYTAEGYCTLVVNRDDDTVAWRA